MNIRRASLSIALSLVTLLTVACGGDDISVGGERDSLAPLAANVCLHRACGADCTPTGTKNYHWCDAQGACVPGGGPTAGAPICSPVPAPASSAGPTASSLLSCTGKACGTDCTVVGSTDYHWCDSQGACVPGGGPTAGAPNCSKASTPSSSCTGKACGTDCTTAGTTDYHWCDKDGACVPGGGPTAGLPMCG